MWSYNLKELPCNLRGVILLIRLRLLLLLLLLFLFFFLNTYFLFLFARGPIGLKANVANLKVRDFLAAVAEGVEEGAEGDNNEIDDDNHDDPGF